MPNVNHESGLCGAMAISMLAHILLRTPLPMDDSSLRHRSWKMKERFVETIFERPPSSPMLWGWGLPEDIDQFCSMYEPWTGVHELESIWHRHRHTGSHVPCLRDSLAYGQDEIEFHFDRITSNTCLGFAIIPLDWFKTFHMHMLQTPVPGFFMILRDNHWNLMQVIPGDQPVLLFDAQLSDLVHELAWTGWQLVPLHFP